MALTLEQYTALLEASAKEVLRIDVTARMLGHNGKSSCAIEDALDGRLRSEYVLAMQRLRHLLTLKP